MLPEQVANQIAAGEVVDRPASVIKELMENAIDAGATRVVVELEEGGKRKMAVIDDGSGMDAEDVRKSVVRHATSKVRNVEDLTRIGTMGFRGEALASIASVSRMTIRSRMQDGRNLQFPISNSQLSSNEQLSSKKSVSSGFEVVIEGGKIVSESKVGMAGGTTVVVEDLFFNVPARKKFLKTTATELRNIVEIMEAMALAWPTVGFVLKHGTRNVLEVSKLQERMARVRSVLGDSLTSQLVPVYFDHPHLQIQGWVGKPQTSQETKVKQFLVVNSRRVSDKVVTGAIKQAMSTLLMPRAQVPWVLYVDVPLEMVDVNVHPRKEEVKFVNGSTIFRAVYDAVETGLKKADLRYMVESKEDGLGNETIPDKEKLADDFGSFNSGRGANVAEKQRGYASKFEAGGGTSRNYGYVREAAGSYATGGYSKQHTPSLPRQNSVPVTSQEGKVRDFLEQVLPWEVDREMVDEMGEIIQLQKLYLVMQTEKGMRLVDQHAAHERIRYEQLLAGWENKDLRSTQALLLPEEIGLSMGELLVVEDNLDTLLTVGFEIGIQKDEKTVSVKAVPAVLTGVKLGSLVREMVGDLLAKDDVESLRKYEDEKVDSQTRRVLVYLACRSAIKGGDYLAPERRRQLLVDLAACKRPYTCPHGRPVEIVVTWGELERMFKRAV